MAIAGLRKTYTAAAAVAANRIVKFTATPGEVVQAAAATDKLMGISHPANVGVDVGRRIDVALSGIEPLQFAGICAAGDPVTADADGKGVKANPAAGTQCRIIGYVQVATAAGDIADVLIAPGFITTPA